MPIPLNSDATHWRYRINELYAHGHDQGTLTPLLTLNAMHTAWGTSSIYGGSPSTPAWRSGRKKEPTSPSTTGR